MLMGAGVGTVREEPKKILLSGSTTRNSGSPEETMFDVNRSSQYPFAVVVAAALKRDAAPTVITHSRYSRATSGCCRCAWEEKGVWTAEHTTPKLSTSSGRRTTGIIIDQPSFFEFFSFIFQLFFVVIFKTVIKQFFLKF